MDTVVLDGTSYVKVAVAAKQFDYTSDYLGQLCRAGKLDAQLVGRTWFVNPDSVAAHKAGTYRGEKDEAGAPSEPDERISKTSPESRTSKLNKAKSSTSPKRTVAPVIKNKTIKTVSTFQERLQQHGARTDAAYEADAAELIPKLKRESTPTEAKTLTVNEAQPEEVPTSQPATPIPTAEAVEEAVETEEVPRKRVRIKAKERPVSFSATELPEISLHGELEVEAAAEESPADEKSQKSKKNKEISAKRGTVVAMTSTQYRRRKKLAVQPASGVTSTASTSSTSAPSSSATATAVRDAQQEASLLPEQSDVRIAPARPQSFMPERDPAVVASTASGSGPLGWRISTTWAWTIFIFALCLAVALVLIETELVINADVVERSWRLRI